MGNANRPAISSMSLGGSGTQAAMKRAVDGAVDAGVVVVVAGGNTNRDACTFSPAFVPSAVTVGSTDRIDRRSSFSNYGSCTEIWAPGSAITSANLSKFCPPVHGEERRLDRKETEHHTLSHQPHNALNCGRNSRPSQQNQKCHYMV